jgi:CheY-like chemotaxis protein
MGAALSVKRMPKKISNNLRLELGLLDQGRKQPRSDESQLPAEGALRVLVVDDDPDMRTFVKACLRRLERPIGHVSEAPDGCRALEMIRAESFDLVISDLMLPQLDGGELCRELRDDPELRHTPVLLMTGEVSAAELRVRSLEADDVILKPFNARQLCEQISGLLDRGPPQGST